MLSRSGVVANVRRTVRALSAGPALGEEALLAAIQDRTREILPKDVEITRTDGVVTLRGVGRFTGSTSIWMPMFIWRAELPAEVRLELLFASHGKRLQDFLTRTCGEPWPSDGAQPYCRIDAERICSWWGGPTEEEAVTRLRPIVRSDLGI